MAAIVTSSRLPRVSWGAIFAGVILSLAVYLILSILGTAIGASVLHPMRDQSPLHGFGFGTGVWLVFTTVVSILVGSYFAGRSAEAQGWLHGVLSWSIVTLLTLYLLGSVAAGVLGTTFNIVGQGLSIAGQGVAAATPALASGAKDVLQQNGVDVNFSSMQNQLTTLLQQTGKPALDPANLKNDVQQAASDTQASAAQVAQQPQQANAGDLTQWFATVRQEAQPALSAADKDALVNIIMARTGKSRPEAQQIADNYEQTYNNAMAQLAAAKQQAADKARQAADAAAKGLARATWWSFAVLVLGAIIGAAAGNLGFRHQPPEVEERLVGSSAAPVGIDPVTGRRL